MNLEYAVDRLYQAGWTPSVDDDLEHLGDGRDYPSVLAVHRAFAVVGLELAIKHNLMFNCYRATWTPVGEPFSPGLASTGRHGTVIGSCEREAAVYALAQLLEAERVGAPMAGLV